ncbi:MAG: FtsX-like permease family protein, partial [Bacteroidota bacterium]|nr:FtsX-like permease family protein [Bacteroidota bacterium]
QKIDASISNEISNIQIHNPRFLEDKSIHFMMDNADSLLGLIEKVPGIKAITKRSISQAMASTASSGNGVLINGIEPEKEKQVTNIAEMLVDGDYFEKEYRTPGMIVGAKLAEKLNARIGSKIVITIQNTENEISYGLYRVSGIYKTSNTMFDEIHVFVRNESLVSLIGIDAEDASEIAILLENNDLTDNITLAVKEKLDGLSVRSWKEVDPALLAFLAMMDQFAYILVLIILLALTFGIVNAMLMSVLERSREIGMLMALGMNRRRIFLMIVMETIFMSLTGAIIGIVLSVVSISFTGQYGINFASWAEGLEAFGYTAFVYPQIETAFYITIGIIVVITAALASIWPARKALKINPASAIREDL